MINFLAVIGLTLVIFAATLLFGFVCAYITDDNDLIIFCSWAIAALLSVALAVTVLGL